MGGLNAITTRQYPAHMKATTLFHEQEQVNENENDSSNNTAEASEKKKVENNSQLSDTTTTTTDEQNLDRWKDPINWFGILPPPALKQSQKDFKAGTYTSHSHSQTQTCTFPLYTSSDRVF